MKSQNHTYTPHAPGYSLVALVILVTALVSLTASSFVITSENEDEKRSLVTQERYRVLKESIFGPVEKVKLNGSTVEMGFINDMGQMPAGNDLGQLTTQGTQKEWGPVGSNLLKSGLSAESIALLSQISVYDGWRGPYVQSETDGAVPTVDGWGNDFKYEGTPTTKFSNDTVKLFSAGKGGIADELAPGQERGYNDDYPFSSSKAVWPRDYKSQLVQVPQLQIRLDEALTDRCNYYVGMIYPGMDLKSQMGAQLVNTCASDPVTQPTETPAQPPAIYTPELPGYFEAGTSNNAAAPTGEGEIRGSLARYGFTLNQDAVFAGSVFVWSKTGKYNQNPEFNLNRNVPSGSKNSGDLWMTARADMRFNNPGPNTPKLIKEGSSNVYDFTTYANGRLGMNEIHTHVETEVSLPPFYKAEPPVGTQWVNLDHSGQSVSDFDTLRGVNVNGGYRGDFVLPPGAYERVGMSKFSRLVLGVAGSTEPSVYSFQTLDMNNCDAIILGPVEIRCANNLNLQRLNGSAENPDWLNVYVEGDVNMNEGSTIYGNVFSKGGNVHINSRATITGHVVADTIVLNSEASLLNGYPGPISTGDEDPTSDGESTPDTSVAGTPASGEDNPGSDGQYTPGSGGDNDSNSDSAPLIPNEALNFSATPEDEATRRSISFDDLIEVAGQPSVFTLPTDAYFNKPLARRYQLAIFHTRHVNDGFPDQSLAQRLVAVLPQVHMTESGQKVGSSDTGSSSSKTITWDLTDVTDVLNLPSEDSLTQN